MVVPFPAQGHLNQLLHLSCLLSSSFDLPIHFISTATHNRKAKICIHGWVDALPTDSKIQFHEIETPQFKSPPPDPNASIKLRMESVTMEVPIAAWPMHSDQPRNAALITKALKVGILVRDWAARDELVNSATIEQVIRKLMGSDEVEEMRLRMAEFGRIVRLSMAEGGVTRLELRSLYTHFTR